MNHESVLLAIIFTPLLGVFILPAVVWFFQGLKDWLVLVLFRYLLLSRFGLFRESHYF
ncbi:MAG: hypothetical protein ABIH27_06250 [Candidatus Omnitrophota bacterium]